MNRYILERLIPVEGKSTEGVFHFTALKLSRAQMVPHMVTESTTENFSFWLEEPEKKFWIIIVTGK